MTVTLVRLLVTGRTRKLAATLTAVSAVVLAAPALASAATVSVAVGGDDATCGRDTGSCATLAQGVAVAAAGDTVLVGAGTFPLVSPSGPGVLINKPLNLRGAQAGISAVTRSGGAETILTDGNPAVPKDSLVRIVPGGAGTSVDGFTITGNQASSPGAAIRTDARAGGYRIANNIITANTMGVYLESTGAETLLTQNRIDNNNVLPPGGSNGAGVYSQQVGNVTISDNLFNANLDSAVLHTIQGGSDLTFSRNRMTDDGSVVLAHIDGLTVADNTWTGGSGSALFLGGDGLSNARVLRNTITGKSATAGITLDRFAGDQNSDVTIAENTIVGIRNADPARGNAISITSSGGAGVLTVARNRIVDNDGAGVRNSDPDLDVAARDNWWGCNLGPGLSGCETVISAAGGRQPSFTPWLVLSIGASPSAIAAGGQSTLTADLSNLSSGGRADGSFFSGAVASFASTPAGTLTPPSAVLDAATARGTSALVASATPTDASTTVDQQSAAITLADPPRPILGAGLILGGRPRLTPGQSAVLSIVLTNRGNRVVRRLRACLQLSAALQRSGKRCATIARLRPGQTIVLRRAVSARLSACGDRPLASSVRVTAPGQDALVRRVSARLADAGRCAPTPCPTSARASRDAGVNARASSAGNRRRGREPIVARAAC